MKIKSKQSKLNFQLYIYKYFSFRGNKLHWWNIIHFVKWSQTRREINKNYSILLKFVEIYVFLSFSIWYFFTLGSTVNHLSLFPFCRNKKNWWYIFQFLEIKTKIYRYEGIKKINSVFPLCVIKRRVYIYEYIYIYIYILHICIYTYIYIYMYYTYVYMYYMNEDNKSASWNDKLNLEVYRCIE